MKLSIVILCWNDLKVITDCLRSIFASTHAIPFEVIVSDNGSTDGSPAIIRKTFPQVRVIENGANLRFAKGNNVAIQTAAGEYVVILNPDTIIHEGSFDRFVEFADRHPECGAFGLQLRNPDGSYQESARPFPTIRGDLLAAFCLRPLAYLSNYFVSDVYTGWKGDTERYVDWQCGACVMVRGDLLRQLGGFDEQFFYYYEDIDLCHRVWDAGYRIIFTPDIAITHLGGQSTKRARHIFEVDKYKTRYRYFKKYYGDQGLRRCRAISLAALRLRRIGYGLLQLLKPNDERRQRLDILRSAIDWNKRIELSTVLVGDGENLSIETVEASKG